MSFSKGGGVDIRSAVWEGKVGDVGDVLNRYGKGGVDGEVCGGGLVRKWVAEE